jgi:hypothetical protein
MQRFAPLFAAGLCALLAASAAQAQTGRTVNRTMSPAASSYTATRTAGQAGRIPIHADGSVGFTGTLPSVSGDSGSSPSLSVPVPATGFNPGGVVGPVEVTPGEGVNTAVLGAGASVMGPSQYISDSGAAGYSATDVARSFFFADANHDGELTRAEFRRLSIMTMPFEQMDRNFDGVISRFEYEDSVR